MKKIVMLAVAVASLGAFASATNLLYEFQPNEDDCYSDGTRVLANESYALVWLANGSDGIEITADCKVADETKGKILRVRKSRGYGKKFSFEVDSSISEPCVKAGGSWAVYLLDTRVYGPDGTVSIAPTENGMTAAINASVKLDRTVVAVANSAGGPGETKFGEQGKATVVTAVPKDTPQPEISGVAFVDGKVRVKVRNTVPYLQYNLASGTTLDSIGGKAAVSPRNGDADGEIELVAPADGSSMVFRVNRN